MLRFPAQIAETLKVAPVDFYRRDVNIKSIYNLVTTMHGFVAYYVHRRNSRRESHDDNGGAEGGQSRDRSQICAHIHWPAAKYYIGTLRLSKQDLLNDSESSSLTRQAQHRSLQPWTLSAMGQTRSKGTSSTLPPFPARLKSDQKMAVAGRPRRLENIRTSPSLVWPYRSSPNEQWRRYTVIRSSWHDAIAGQKTGLSVKSTASLSVRNTCLLRPLLPLSQPSNISAKFERLLMKGPSNDSLMATGTSNGTTTTECSPLLQKVKGSQDTRLQCHQVSRSTRHYILGALWAGTFFCVSQLSLWSPTASSIVFRI
ncbi:hypothetical protein JVT61DRAFT_9815 [Boletus reticuloceps]|uniref:Uncharacterized protein n=1 Tax=Boletus reticuloceps TaxID=495285 RepID=A0A8I2YG24_9AGAM|nr:hypothetical protein JVT61DRAFT_9815 [Boletus reticuloceps]